VAKCFELLEPGGRFVLVTWCHREVPPGLSQTERAFLRSLYSLYHLPYVLSVSQYARIMEDSGFREVKTADWTPAVAPFWREVARATAKPGNIAGVLQAGWPTVKGAVAVLLMLEGYRRGLLRYGLLTGVKP
jgi:tocopherol O-methyltransferase